MKMPNAGASAGGYCSPFHSSSLGSSRNAWSVCSHEGSYWKGARESVRTPCGYSVPTFALTRSSAASSITSMASVPADLANTGSPTAASLVGASGSRSLEQIERLQLPGEFIVPGDDIEVLLQAEYVQSAQVRPKRDGAVAFLQAIQSVPGDIDPLGKKYGRYASTQSG